MSRPSFLHRHRVTLATGLVLFGLAFSCTFYSFAAFASFGCVEGGFGMSCSEYWGLYALLSLVPGLSAVGFTLWALVLRFIPYARIAAACGRVLRR